MKAKKSLGQNFLTSPAIASRIARAGGACGGDTVVEIGPGKGILTRALLATGARVIAIEKDDRAIPLLHNLFKSEITAKKLIIIHGDALLLTPKDLGIPGKYKVIANIPYYITGALIRHYLESKKQPETLVFLVQKEVGKRMTEKIKENLLSLSVKAYGKPTYIETISARFFKPEPKVDSAVVRIDEINRDFFKKISEKGFFNLIHLGFSSKRKMVIGNLSKQYSRDILLKIFKDISLPEKARAEDISLATWKKLSEKLLS